MCCMMFGSFDDCVGESKIISIVCSRAHFSVQLITICAVVKSKCAVEKGNICTKKCRDSVQSDELCANYPVLCSCTSCLKYALVCRRLFKKSRCCKKGIIIVSL